MKSRWGRLSLRSRTIAGLGTTLGLAGLMAAWLLAVAQPAAGQGSSVYFGFSQAADYGGWPSSLNVAQQESSIDPGAVERFDLNWAALQPTCKIAALTAVGVCPEGPGAFDWSLLDTVVSHMKADGVKLLLNIISSPVWAWNPLTCGAYCADTPTGTGDSSPAGIAMPPADDSTGNGYLQSMVESVLERYDSLDPGEIVGIEAWNEENVRPFWPTTMGPNATDYTNLLCSIYSAAKSVNPSIPVILGGLANTSAVALNDIDIPTFLSDAYAAGAGSCMNAVAVHAYPAGDPSAANSDLPTVVQDANTADANGGHPSLPVWITEFGYCTADTSDKCPNPMTPDQQAAYIDCGYQLALGMPNVAAVIVDNLDDGPGPSTSPSTLQGPPYYGVYTIPGDPKADGSGYGAVGMLTDMFHGGGSVGPIYSSCQADYWNQVYHANPGDPPPAPN
jgi:hypothetical protein